MKYRPYRYMQLQIHKAIDALMRQLRVRVRIFSRRAEKATRKWRILWEDSELAFYLERLKIDALRAVQHTSPEAAAAFTGALCVCIVAGISLVSSHLEAKVPTHSMLQSVAAEEGQVDHAGQFEMLNLVELKNSGLGKETWYVVGNINHKLGDKKIASKERTPESTASIHVPGSPLALQGKTPVLKTLHGEQPIQRLSKQDYLASSSVFLNGNMTPIATGEYDVEVLLAELTSQQHSPTDWQGGIFSSSYQPGVLNSLFGNEPRHWSGLRLKSLPDEADSPLFCSTDRMVTGSWVALLHKNYAKANRRSAKKASQYQQYVERYAGRYKLAPSLVYAIMHIESSFNPVAVSHANALGLMQVVPATAGGEVYSFLNKGAKGNPTPETLFTPEQNILYGTTYLHLLGSRHFKGVEDPVSRELCMIAAYNGGPFAVYRVFSRDKSVAIEAINKLSSEQLYAKLTREIRAEETRDYLARVVQAKNDYRRGDLNF